MHSSHKLTKFAKGDVITKIKNFAEPLLKKVEKDPSLINRVLSSRGANMLIGAGLGVGGMVARKIFRRNPSTFSLLGRKVPNWVLPLAGGGAAGYIAGKLTSRPSQSSYDSPY